MSDLFNTLGKALKPELINLDEDTEDEIFMIDDDEIAEFTFVFDVDDPLFQD